MSATTMYTGKRYSGKRFRTCDIYSSINCAINVYLIYTSDFPTSNELIISTFDDAAILSSNKDPVIA